MTEKQSITPLPAEQREIAARKMDQEESDRRRFSNQPGHAPDKARKQTSKQRD